jgi:photosystem II stability/assembly factor-like uncharacterized protein
MARLEQAAGQHTYLNSLMALNAPNTLLVSYNDDLLKTTDAGCTWKSLRAALPAGGTRVTVRAAMRDGGALVSVAGAGLFRVTLGDSVERVASPLQSLNSVAIDRDNARHWRAAGEGPLTADGRPSGEQWDGRVMDSADAGRSWSVVGKVPLKQFEGGDMTFAPSNLNRLLFQSSVHGASVSDDGGRTWVKTSGLPEGAWAAVFSPVDDKIVWAASRGDRIYLSADGGKTFTRAFAIAPKRVGTLAPHPTNKDLLYYVRDETWLATFDRRSGATTEQRCPRPDPYVEIAAIVASPATPSLIYLGLTKRGIIVGL